MYDLFKEYYTLQQHTIYKKIDKNTIITLVNIKIKILLISLIIITKLFFMTEMLKLASEKHSKVTGVLKNTQKKLVLFKI